MKKVLAILSSLAIVVMTIPAMGGAPAPVARHGVPNHGVRPHFQNHIPGHSGQVQRFTPPKGTGAVVQ